MLSKKIKLKIKASACHATILWSLKKMQTSILFMDKHIFNGNIEKMHGNDKR